MLFIDTVPKKKKVESDWKESFTKNEMLEFETPQDFAKVVDSKHDAILGVSHQSSAFVAFSQEDGKFSNQAEEDNSRCCWTCGVPVLRVKKSLCAGCLRARYCTEECLGKDWTVHGDWCRRRKNRREERRKMKERAEKDIAEDNVVD